MPATRTSASWPWPPEVPPLRPEPPTEPPRRPPQPAPVIPSWEEADRRSFGFDMAERLLDQRVVFVAGRLDDAAANRAAAQLLLLSRRDRTRPIEVHLACPEAELPAALALADAVDLATAPVHVVVRGAVAGPAVAVLCVAQDRMAPRHAVVMLSVPRISAEGTAAELDALAKQYEHQVARLQELIARTTGRSDADVAADLDAGRVLTGEEALEYGLVNRLL